MTLTEFLLARIAEDERVAQVFRDCDWGGVDAWGDGSDLFFGDNPPASVERVLAECEAKQRIVEEHAQRAGGWDPGDCRVCGDELPCPTLRFLATPYADHPDYRDEWKP